MARLSPAAAALAAALAQQALPAADNMPSTAPSAHAPVASPGPTRHRDGALARFVEREALIAAATPLEHPRPDNPFTEPISIETAEAGDRIMGSMVVWLPYPYERLSRLLVEPARLCEVLYLHINIKGCVVQPRAASHGGDAHLLIAAGRRDEGTADAGHRVDNRLHVLESGSAQTRIELSAAQGPAGTRDYLVSVQLVALPGQRTAMRMHYGYTVGAMARAAMRTYLATVGQDKVGFTPIGQQADGKPKLVGGVRGATERNLMRYYLAFEASAAVPDGPAPANRSERLRRWHAGAERHARQLRELSLQDYLAQKHDGASRALR